MPRPNPKLVAVADAVKLHKVSNPDATTDDMVDVPSIAAAIDAYEPFATRARTRAKDIVRAAIVLDVDANGKPHYVNIIQSRIQFTDPSAPPITVQEHTYVPQAVARVQPRAVRNAMIRRFFKKLRTQLQRFEWVDAAALTEILAVLDTVEARLVA